MASMLLAVVSACAATQRRSYLAAGDPPPCCSGRDLGRVGILPEHVWRRDQKDVEWRSSTALAAIERVFDRWRCAGGTRMWPAASWTARLESDVLHQAASRILDTVLFVCLEELGPTVALTLSLPILWVGTSEVLLDAAVHRSRGRPFQLRPASWADQELEDALSALLGSDGARLDAGSPIARETAGDPAGVASR